MNVIPLNSGRLEVGMGVQVIQEKVWMKNG